MSTAESNSAGSIKPESETEVASSAESIRAKVTLPREYEERIESIKKLYPDQRSAVMPALYLAQEHFGYISDDAVLWVSDRVNIPPVHVREVATFYTMFYKKPVGRYHFQVCRTLSCAIVGARKLTDHLHSKLKILPGEVSEDGMWSYEEVECLGSCGTAPMCELNDTFFEKLTVEKLDQIMDTISRSNPDLRFSTVKDDLGEGIPGAPKSEVI